MFLLHFSQLFYFLLPPDFKWRMPYIWWWSRLSYGGSLSALLCPFFLAYHLQVLCEDLYNEDWEGLALWLWF